MVNRFVSGQGLVQSIVLTRVYTVHEVDMFTNEFVRQLVQHLSEACGFAMTMVEGSFSHEGAFASAAAESVECVLKGSQLCMDVRAQILFTLTDEGGDIWALVFFYINGARVSPTGFNHLMLKWETGDSGTSRWVARGWEADVYDEWTDAERLEDMD